MRMRKIWIPMLLALMLFHCAPRHITYTNPILHADYSDPDVIRVGEDYYMVSSSFAHVPGLPVLYSRDLVHWEILCHAVPRLPDSLYDQPQHSKGIWAPSIRYYRGEFRIYYGDPDFGIYLVKSADPAGPWEAPLLVHRVKGWIDPCPFWDEDGQAYLVHAWAKSRVGFNSILTLHRMSPDGTRILDEGVMVFDGHEHHPTIEGPKMYKRNGWYYIFAPAGGVKSGWQTVLRARSIFGPYEDKIVLEQGKTEINGPHQGAWVELANGDDKFIHFQDHGAYGRIIHMQPLHWEEDWPRMGSDLDGNGIGEPVPSGTVPYVKGAEKDAMPMSDDFSGDVLGQQWQWQANIDTQWYDLKSKAGWLRLPMYPITGDYKNLWNLPNILAQKFPADAFEVATRLSFQPQSQEERAGLVVFGNAYAAITIHRDDQGYVLEQIICQDAEKGGEEVLAATARIHVAEVFFKAKIATGARVQFSYSLDGCSYRSLGPLFTAMPGKWVGAKIGLFAMNKAEKTSGYSDFDFFQVEIIE